MVVGVEVPDTGVAGVMGVRKEEAAGCAAGWGVEGVGVKIEPADGLGGGEAKGEEAAAAEEEEEEEEEEELVGAATGPISAVNR